MARCLITGHKGYIGSKLYNELIKQGHDVLGIDSKDGHDINTLQGLVEDNEGGFHPMWFTFKPEYVFHLACWPRVSFSIENPVKTMKNNVIAASNVFNYAKKVGAKRVIYSSSSSVVGNGAGPESPYALQKLTTEIEAKIYSQLYGLDTVSLRYFNVYSPDQKADGPYATAISNWMEFIRQKKLPFITGTGEQRRDMLHVEDAVSANIFAMNKKENFNGKVYDVGTGTNISLNEVKDIVKKHFPNLKFSYVNERPNDVMLTKANTEPMKELGWSTNVSIAEGIEECFRRLAVEEL